MNIGIDARVLENKMSGIGRYLLDILKGISLYDSENKYTLFSTREILSTYKQDFQLNNFTFINSGNKGIPTKLFSPFWLNFVLPKLIEKNKIDFFFSPNNLLPAKKLKCKSVLTVHDVFHLINKKYHPFFYRTYLNFQLPHSIKNSDTIITISETSKADLVRFFKVDSTKISVIYRAADPKFKPINFSQLEFGELRKRLHLPQKFVLYVGIIENRKNISGILKIADIVFKNRQDIKFLLVGKPGHGFKEIQSEIIKRKNAIYLSYIEEDDIVSIYNLAFLFIFPSFYEGFGLPPLEAMQCGIPVLCSNIPALREVVGTNGFLRDPQDYNAFADDITSLLKNPDLYAEMKVRSINQSKKFSFDESIKRLFQIINDIKKNN